MSFPSDLITIGQANLSKTVKCVVEIFFIIIILKNLYCGMSYLYGELNLFHCHYNHQSSLSLLFVSYSNSWGTGIRGLREAWQPSPKVTRSY